MKSANAASLADIIRKYEGEILADWLKEQAAGQTRRDQVHEAETRTASRDFLTAVADGLASGAGEDARGAGWARVRDLLNDMSTTRATHGYTPTETALFVFSLKQPLFARLRKDLDGNALADALWSTTLLIDGLGLYTTEAYQKTREEVIQRQQRELLELSTPVVQLWQDVLALPLIGTLDSGRTQVVMESLLEKIVESGASIAIIDITGVPTVDTLVAQHLMKTVAAARLMGADCIISGIRPQIAQTIVHLGVDLSAVTTKASLADAFALALKRVGARIEAGAKA
ncbi:MAG TPA: STAS domain-containing protein [Usitatibacter sp.]|nr:STAS domain-containing protein [Usitatibacter sp.]